MGNERKRDCGASRNVCLSKSNQRTWPRPSYADLPDVALFQIFGYLTHAERCRNAKMCRRWYQVAKSPAFWQKVDVEVLNPSQVLKLLPYLPSCVIHLRICCSSVDIRCPLYFPEFMAKIRERCPSLKTLILEKIFLPENSSDRCAAEQFALEKYPQELIVLSLRNSLFVTCLLSSRLIAFIPRIRVLDFTQSLCITDEVVPFFSNLTELEELYLLGCPITGSGIANLLKAVKNLKVLDLENTGIHSGTFSDLKEFGQSLEKLYLANTLLDDSYLSFSDENDTFQRLEALCLRNTFVSADGVQHLLDSCPSLQSVNVTQCKVSTIWLQERFRLIRRRLIYDVTSTHLPYCNHFEKNNFCYK